MRDGPFWWLDVLCAPLTPEQKARAERESRRDRRIVGAVLIGLLLAVAAVLAGMFYAGVWFGSH